MNNGSLTPIAPPPPPKSPGKPPYLLLGIGAIVLIVLFSMFSGSKSSVASAGGAASAASASDATDAPTAPTAPVAKAAAGNPILGSWTLLDTDMASVCREERVFETYNDARAKGENPAIYVVKPTYVEVGYGGPNMEEWELHGPDDITLRMMSPSNVGYTRMDGGSQANCRYHRK